MNEQQDFIGMGHNPNPNVPDIPVGFGMALFQDSVARNYFENLNDMQKTNVIRYIQDNNITGHEAKEKIRNAVENLREHSIDFINFI